jgi:MoaA/NifB/PqqE/SkfB family radical SAM enzyme
MFPTYRTVIQGVSTLRIGAPVSVQIELTEACQYHCIFCYNAWRELVPGRKVQALTHKQTMLIVRKLIELEIFDLVYSGGEPTLCPHLVEAVELATSHGIEVSLISNA